MKSYAVYYLADDKAYSPINVFDSIRMAVRDGAYIFFELRSDEPLAVCPINSFYVLEVAE